MLFALTGWVMNMAGGVRWPTDSPEYIAIVEWIKQVDDDSHTRHAAISAIAGTGARQHSCLGQICMLLCCCLRFKALIEVTYHAPYHGSSERDSRGYAVVTMINRDYLKEDRAELFARTIRAISERIAGSRVEVLVLDYLYRP